MNDYQRIEKAIIYINENFREQPDLDMVAQHVHLSPFHFQRLFKEWAGVSPKKFLQYVTVEHAKKLLRKDFTLADTGFETGLSGTGRLHDLFINIDGMTPGEYKNGGESLQIKYSYSDTMFGSILIASTAKGICYLAFEEDEAEGLNNLILQFPNAVYTKESDALQKRALQAFNGEQVKAAVKLHLKGTPFQLKVWQALLQIPSGNLKTYADVADEIALPKAARAVGSAIGANPVAFLIPCHRVIKSTGVIGQYHWGTARKTAIIGWESSHAIGE
ncbi:methylated-DNA--[protein]-cysteine S-methyltransferase [Chitinophagaceae bacterium LWZ2-11]